MTELYCPDESMSCDEVTSDLLIRIRRNIDGVTADQLEKNGFFSRFNWTENNYSCDCNRELFFWRAVGRETIGEHRECSDGDYSVKITDAITGRVLLDEIGDMPCFVIKEWSGESWVVQ
jgi:hypothetical protein